MDLASVARIPRFLIAYMGGYTASYAKELTRSLLRNGLSDAENELLLSTTDVTTCVNAVFERLAAPGRKTESSLILPFFRSKPRLADQVMRETLAAEAVLEGAKTLDTIEVFRDRLAGIDTQNAPSEIRIALSRYIMAIEDHMAAHTAGGDTNAANEAVVAAKQNLHRAIDRNRATAY